MHLALSILSAGVIVSSLAPNKPEFGRKVDGIIGEIFNEHETALVSNENPTKLNNQRKIPGRVLIDEEEDDIIEDIDFDGDEFDDEDFKGLLGEASVASLMHMHHEEGEILVPCFGMWWPIGGYNTGFGGGYDYIDYYGDYKKKRRRSRKQKKAAKMKKKRN